ncbi:MAG: hypothetical protein LBT05_12520 [Planctomycetaceae bacterium]|nr:hypothetical protein [Planctomycetaceae bacterium]
MKIKKLFILCVLPCLFISSGIFRVLSYDFCEELFAFDSGTQNSVHVLDEPYFPYADYQRLEKLQEQNNNGADWAKETIEQLVSFFRRLQNSEKDLHADLSVLSGLLLSAPESEFVSLNESEEPFTAQSVAKSLQIRLPLWSQVVAALEEETILAESEKYGTVPSKHISDAIRLYKKSDAIRTALLLNQNGPHWVQFFQLNPLHEQLVSLLPHQEPIAIAQVAEPTEKYASQYPAFSGEPKSNAQSSNTTHFSDLSDVLLEETERRKICSTVHHFFMAKNRVLMKPDQSQLLEIPAIQDWLAEMEQWQGNPVHPLELLSAYEEYRYYRGMSDSSRLALLSRQMTGSKSQALQELGQTVQNEFTHAHLKVYISRYLINTMLPPRDPEFDVVRETIAGQEVVGKRRADTQVNISLIPDPNRLLMSLNIHGQVVTQTTATTFPATLHNQSRGTYVASKQLELTAKGVQISPAKVTANSAVKLRDVKTDLDILPFVGDVVREIAKGQYQNQQSQIQADVKSKVLAQAKQRVDSEADERFKIFNERLERLFIRVIRQQNASLELHEAKTTEEWLLTSWYLSTPVSLGSDSKDPATPEGAIADLKVHELGLNAALERLNLAGKQLTIAELRRYLTNVIQRSDLDLPAAEGDDVAIGFAKINPLGIRFLKNRVELSLNLSRLLVDNKEWNDFCVLVNYIPGVDADGSPCLTRDGAVQLVGDLNLTQQVALRAIFSKIFHNRQPISLKPKLFREDERFAGLNTGFVRIDNGWFAIALVPQQTSQIPQQQLPPKITKLQWNPPTQRSTVVPARKEFDVVTAIHQDSTIVRK